MPQRVSSFPSVRGESIGKLSASLGSAGCHEGNRVRSFAGLLAKLPKSVADVDMCRTGGLTHRPTDEPADRLLLSIIEQRKKQKEAWDRAKDLQELEKRSDHL